MPTTQSSGYDVALISAGDCHNFRLARLIEWAGLERDKFTLYDTTTNPPSSIDLTRHRVLVPMGNVATSTYAGLEGILTVRGYIQAGQWGNHILPTVSTSFIQRGQSKWSAAFIADIQKAVELAARGLPPQITEYVIDPSPLVAYAWAKDYRGQLLRNPSLRLAFDIETPGKGEDEDGLETDENGASDRTYHIYRIGFSYRPLTALSIPWEPQYFAAIRLLLESDGDKIVWNAGFDVPRVRRAGIPARGLIHDGMVAWHILHSDLPKKLGFVATFTCPWQPRWKHLSGSHPGFYNATDADVEWRSMECIDQELRRTGLWGVYQSDILDLEPVLVHMTEKGMPVDSVIREDRAKKLAEKLASAHHEMTSVVPLEARKIEKVFVNTPKSTEGLLSRPGSRVTTVCSACGAIKPRKDHFKRFVKKLNPCSDAELRRCNVDVQEWYRLAPFTPSRDQLSRYHAALKRPLPMVWDKDLGRKKVSFGEKQLKELRIKYPNDPLYGIILDYRQIDKLAGTYIGRPVD
jgi:hypothetical protein